MDVTNAGHPLPLPQDDRPFAVSRVDEPSRRARVMRLGGGALGVAIALFVVLNAGDVVSTYLGLQNGLHEGNPLMSRLLDHFGFGALVIYKLAVVIVVVKGIAFLQTINGGAARLTIWVCNTLVFAVVILNVAQYLLR
jgi:hypothetical protein